LARLRLAARWVVPVTSDPIENGAVLVEDGRIVAIGPDTKVSSPAELTTRHLGDCALLPGLINTHTHLELTALRGLVPGTAFPRWVGSIRRIKDQMTPAQFQAGARWGVLEHLALGATTIGDTGSTGAAARAMLSLGARGVAYQEVFGPDPGQCEASLAGLRRDLAALDREAASDRVHIGVSPHAPYTVSRQLAGAVASLARIQQRRIAMHVAESAEEMQFIEAGQGAFAEHLRGRSIPVTTYGVSPVQWALDTGLAQGRPLLIHCVHIDRHDAQAIARCDASVAHCPWSNQLLGVGRADLALLRAEGVRVGVGTDSVAAGNGFDLFHELRLAAMGAPMSPRERLAMITCDAADALGIPDAGRIEPGAYADLIAVQLNRPVFAGSQSIEGALVAAAQGTDVSHTWVAGELRYAEGAWPGVDGTLERQAIEKAGGELSRILGR
jgi:cytosine/adenosine deaminase-related metal-dependent hydrolase